MIRIGTPNWNLIKRRLRFYWQRITRGWTDEDLWNLDYAIAKFTLPRIKEFKESQCGLPADMTEKEWNEILDKIILAFELIIDDCQGRNLPDSPEEIRQSYMQIDTGTELFGKHLRALWW